MQIKKTINKNLPLSIKERMAQLEDKKIVKDSENTNPKKPKSTTFKTISNNVKEKELLDLPSRNTRAKSYTNEALIFDKTKPSQRISREFSNEKEKHKSLSTKSKSEINSPKTVNKFTKSPTEYTAPNNNEKKSEPSTENSKTNEENDLFSKGLGLKNINASRNSIIDLTTESAADIGENFMSSKESSCIFSNEQDSGTDIKIKTNILCSENISDKCIDSDMQDDNLYFDGSNDIPIDCQNNNTLSNTKEVVPHSDKQPLTTNNYTKVPSKTDHTNTANLTNIVDEIQTTKLDKNIECENVTSSNLYTINSNENIKPRVLDTNTDSDPNLLQDMEQNPVIEKKLSIDQHQDQILGVNKDDKQTPIHEDLKSITDVKVLDSKTNLSETISSNVQAQTETTYKGDDEDSYSNTLDKVECVEQEDVTSTDNSSGLLVNNKHAIEIDQNVKLEKNENEKIKAESTKSSDTLMILKADEPQKEFVQDTDYDNKNTFSKTKIEQQGFFNDDGSQPESNFINQETLEGNFETEVTYSTQVSEIDPIETKVLETPDNNKMKDDSSECSFVSTTYPLEDKISNKKFEETNEAHSKRENDINSCSEEPSYSQNKSKETFDSNMDIYKLPIKSVNRFSEKNESENFDNAQAELQNTSNAKINSPLILKDTRPSTNLTDQQIENNFDNKSIEVHANKHADNCDSIDSCKKIENNTNRNLLRKSDTKSIFQTDHTVFDRSKDNKSVIIKNNSSLKLIENPEKKNKENQLNTNTENTDTHVSQNRRGSVETILYKTGFCNLQKIQTDVAKVKNLESINETNLETCEKTTDKFLTDKYQKSVTQKKQRSSSYAFDNNSKYFVSKLSDTFNNKMILDKYSSLRKTSNNDYLNSLENQEQLSGGDGFLSKLKNNFKRKMPSFSLQQTISEPTSLMYENMKTNDPDYHYFIKSKVISGDISIGTKGFTDPVHNINLFDKANEDEENGVEDDVLETSIIRENSISISDKPFSRSKNLAQFDFDKGNGVDWDYWGTVVSEYDKLYKNEYSKLEKSVLNGVPPSLRGTIWQIMTNSKDSVIEGEFVKLLKQSSAYEKLILQDVNRTFRKLDYYNEQDGDGQQALFNVLKAYSLYDTKVGYCQGLSFIVAPILLNLPEEETFCILVKLMEKYDLKHNYTNDMYGIHLLTYQFDKLFELNLPHVYNHLRRQNVDVSMYIPQWFMTIFSHKSSMCAVFRVFDVFLFKGTTFLHNFGLSLLSQNEKTILSLSFDEMLDFLTSKIFNELENDIELLDILIKNDNFKVEKKFLTKCEKEFKIVYKRQTEEQESMLYLSSENKRLSDENKLLQEKTFSLTNEQMDFKNELFNTQSELKYQKNIINSLKSKINQLEQKLLEERRSVESQMKDELELLGNKNIQLVNRNIQLEDELAKSESFCESLRLKVQFTESKDNISQHSSEPINEDIKDKANTSNNSGYMNFMKSTKMWGFM